MKKTIIALAIGFGILAAILIGGRISYLYMIKSHLGVTRTNHKECLGNVNLSPVIYYLRNLKIGMAKQNVIDYVKCYDYIYISENNAIISYTFDSGKGVLVFTVIFDGDGKVREIRHSIPQTLIDE